MQNSRFSLREFKFTSYTTEHPKYKYVTYLHADFHDVKTCIQHTFSRKGGIYND